MYRSITTRGTISNSCLLGGCDGIVRLAPTCPSGYNDYSPERIETFCGRESGLATFTPVILGRASVRCARASRGARRWSSL